MTLILAAALLGMFTLTGCNTVEGFGKDLKKAGGELEEAAAK
nr:entericidin A/B family lipoprotein [Cellvibrio sp. PSBB006]